MFTIQGLDRYLPLPFTSKKKRLWVHWDGMSYLTLAFLREDRGKVHWEAFAQKRLSSLEDSKDTISPPKFAIKKEIELFIDQHKLSSSQELIWIVPEKHLILRRFVLPKLPQKEMHSAILLNVKKNLPYRISDIVYVYKLLSLEEGKIEVIFYGILKEYIREVVPSVYLESTTFLPQDYAVISAAKAMGYLPNGLFALLYDKDDASTGVILGDTYGSFVFRDVPQKGNLVAEVELFVEYYKRQNREVDLGLLKKIYFRFKGKQELGGYELVDSEEVMEKLGYKDKDNVLSLTGPFLCFGGLFIIRRDNAIAIRYKNSSTPAKASGSFIFLQQLWDAWIAKVRLDIALVVLGVLLLLSGIRFLLVYRKFADSQRRYQKIVKNLPLVPFAKEKGVPQKEEILRKKEEMNRRINYYQQLKANRKQLAPILITLTKSLPPGFWLKLPFELSQDVNQGNLQLLLNGGVYLGDPDKEISAVDDFLEVLKTKLSDYFSQVELLFSRREKDPQTGIEYLGFSISCGQGQ